MEGWVFLLLAFESEVTFPTYFEVLHTSFFELKNTLPIFTSRGFMKPQLLGLFFIFLPFFSFPFLPSNYYVKVDDILIDDFGHYEEQFETLK